MEEIKINTKKWFAGFCFLHVFLWTIVPTIFVSNVYMDTAESIAWGLQWQLGYDKHPPLTGWLAAIFSSLGPYINFQIFLMGTLMSLVAFWAVWRIASRILTPAKALVSVLLLDCALYFNCYCVTITPDTTQIPFWALVFLAFFIALKEEKVFYWIILGIACALNFYSKYSALLVFTSMAALIFLTSEGRKQLFRKGVYVCFITFIILIIPHIIWSYQDGFSEVGYALNSGIEGQIEQSYTLLERVMFGLNFIGGHIGFSILAILLALTFIFCKRDKNIKVSHFDKQFVYFMAFGPIILTLIYPIVFNARLLPRWGFSMFSLFGIIAMMWINPIITKKVFKRFIILFLVVVCIISISYSVFYGYWAANVNGNYRPWTYFPGKKIANKVTEVWQNKYHVPLKYVAGSHYLVAYITAYSKDHPIPFFDWKEKESKWINVDNMKKDGAVFVWWTKNSPQGMPSEKVFAEVKKRFPNLEKPEILHFDKVGIPKDGKPILKNYLKEHYPKLLAKPVIHQFFPDYSASVDIGVAILPPGR